MFLTEGIMKVTSYTEQRSRRGVIFTAHCVKHGDLAERTNEEDIIKICLKHEFNHIVGDFEEN